MHDNQPYIIETKDVSISFPGVRALDQVNFILRSGEVRAVVGANGAGKSTLMKVLAGANPTYEGDIFVNGEKQQLRTPHAAKELGIEIVYQEVDTALFGQLTVAENIMFNQIAEKKSRHAFINWKSIQNQAKQVLSRLNVELDVNLPASSLSLAQKQMVLIARAISEQCHFLILDEPTAPLSLTETQELFRVVRELMRTEKIGIVFISHRLPELLEICQTMTVMRDGKIVHETDIMPQLTTSDIVAWMLGDRQGDVFEKKAVTPGDILLEAEHLCDTTGMVKDVSLHVRRGEIVGVAGLVGAGKTELSKILFGALPLKSGTIAVRGKTQNIKSPTSAAKFRLGLVPEERRKEGVLVSDPVDYNLSAACMDRFCHMGFISRKRERSNAEHFVQELNIRTPSIDQRVAFLSGGNQQKVVIGKWLAADCDMYIMDEPTKGVDVGAKREIYSLIQSIVEQGKSVLYLSCENSEILSLTDRVYVMYNGQISAELKTAETDEQEILYYSTGGVKQ